MSTVLAAVLLSAALIPVPVRAFELLRIGPTCGNTQHLFWSPPSAAVDSSPVPTDRRNVADTARQRWNQVLRGFDFRTGFGSVCDSNDGIAAMAFSETDCGGADLRNVLGVTRLRWNENTGMLLDTDVIFNAESASLRDDAVFLQVAMHELGHVLGLDHSDACGDSGNGTLMKSVLVLTDPRIGSPTADDLAGADFIYPPPPSVGGSPQSGSCAIVPASGSGHGAWILLPMPLVFARRWLRPRPRPRARPRAPR